MALLLITEKRHLLEFQLFSISQCLLPISPVLAIAMQFSIMKFYFVDKNVWHTCSKILKDGKIKGWGRTWSDSPAYAWELERGREPSSCSLRQLTPACRRGPPPPPSASWILILIQPILAMPEIWELLFSPSLPLTFETLPGHQCAEEGSISKDPP